MTLSHLTNLGTTDTAHRETAFLGLAHGLGFVALALLIWYAAIRHEAPYTLLAATLTPVGPVGSVIAIHYIDRKYKT